MYRYETHLHTAPVSACAKTTVRENLEFYKELGYDGVFVTNHFLDGNITQESDQTYEELIEFFCSDYEEGVQIGKELGIKVFFGAEFSYKGTDFLIYGLNKSWLLAHPEIMTMTKREELSLLMESGALVIQAHPFREARYIDHIRLFPRSVQGVEIYNACRTDFENHMAELYAKEYGLIPLAGTDNHRGRQNKLLGGIETDTPIETEKDLIDLTLTGKIRLFSCPNPLLDTE